MPIKEIIVYLQEIEGIVCYSDRNGNLYDMEDIMSNKSPVRMISSRKMPVTFKIIDKKNNKKITINK
jgi:hypothetical protein